MVVPLNKDMKLYLLVINIVAICDLSPTLARKYAIKYFHQESNTPTISCSLLLESSFIAMFL